MSLPVLTVIIFIFIIWSNYEIRKNSKHSKEDTEKFWNRESEANISRRTDISTLNYIVISTQRLPIEDTSDSVADHYRDILLGLSGKYAINLCNYTNTQLKLKYGVSNLKELTEYDSNYITLVTNLQKWASRLYNLSYPENAALVLEYAVSCNTDVMKSYQLLEQIYKEQNHPEKIKTLNALMSSLPSWNEDK